MTTRAIVPNGDGEGSLGTSTAKWGAVYSSDPANGENSGQVPTTAWVQKLLADALKTAKDEIYKQAKLDAHPVGSYYWSNDSTSPGTLFGGTWEAIAPGYGLIAQGTATAEDGTKLTFTAGNKYGEFKHQLTVGELPQLTVSTASAAYLESKAGNGGRWAVQSVESDYSDTFKNQWVYSTSLDTKGLYHDNLTPAVAVYCWKRII